MLKLNLRLMPRASVILTTLATRAEEGRAPCVHDAANARATNGAGLALAVVDAPVAFVCAAVIAAINVFRVNVHRRAVFDCFREDGENRFVQARDAAR